MKITIPKGSYHEYCRNKNYSKSSQSQRQKLGKLGQTEKAGHSLKDFSNFQEYLLFLQQKGKYRQNNHKSHTERPYCTAQTSRPRTQALRRNQDENNGSSKDEENLIKPFFPFFKCRIQSTSSPTKDHQFRINNKRFKLNYRIIEENMGRGDERNY